jgi:hypothetical protein
MLVHNTQQLWEDTMSTPSANRAVAGRAGGSESLSGPDVRG